MFLAYLKINRFPFFNNFFLLDYKTRATLSYQIRSEVMFSANQTQGEVTYVTFPSLFDTCVVCLFAVIISALVGDSDD